MRKASSTIVIGLCMLAVVVVVAGLAVGPRLIVRDRPATIVAVSGTVLYRPARGSDWITARSGMPLKRGDQLLTVPPDGKATVHMDDGSVGFVLETDSLLTWTAGWNVLRLAASDGVYLSHGSLIAVAQKEVPKARTRFRVETEAAEVAIQGTTLAVQVLKEAPTARVQSLEGEVKVRAKLAAAALYSPDGQRLSVRETVLGDNQTLLVHVDAPSAESRTLPGRVGRVVDDETGVGQQGVVVDVVGSPGLFAVTDADGYFAIEGAAADSELMLVGTSETAQGNLELRLDVGHVTGRVIDQETGEAIARASVVPLELPALATETGADGSFVLHELPVGTHSVSVAVAGYAGAAAAITVEPHMAGSLPDIEMMSLALLSRVFMPTILKNYVQYVQYP